MTHAAQYFQEARRITEQIDCEMIERMGEDEEIPMGFAQKILGENARTFYGF